MFARCLPPILTIRWGSEEADAALFHRPLAPASLVPWSLNTECVRMSFSAANDFAPIGSFAPVLTPRPVYLLDRGSDKNHERENRECEVASRCLGPTDRL